MGCRTEHEMHPVRSRFTHFTLKHSWSMSPSQSNHTSSRKTPAATSDHRSEGTAVHLRSWRSQGGTHIKRSSLEGHRDQEQAGATCLHLLPSTRCAHSSPIRQTTASRCVNCYLHYYGLRHWRQSCSEKGSSLLLLSHWHRKTHTDTSVFTSITGHSHKLTAASEKTYAVSI